VYKCIYLIFSENEIEIVDVQEFSILCCSIIVKQMGGQCKSNVKYRDAWKFDFQGFCMPICPYVVWPYTLFILTFLELVHSDCYLHMAGICNQKVAMIRYG
jgi:hypothetical protein